ncbi:MAG: hypothetical protein JWL77_6953 [Chthonomonadaceae bacterium]|nr:hypothetical protein [Chthonomonadaceae bacterium]
MPFHEHGFTFTPVQASKLEQNIPVLLRHSALSGPHKLHVSTRLHNKIEKAKTKGAGLLIKLTPNERKRNNKVRTGGSFLPIGA